MSQGMPIFEWRPGILVNEEDDNEQDYGLSVQLEERHTNDEEDMREKDEERSVLLDGERGEESENEDFNIDEHDNIP